MNDSGDMTEREHRIHVRARELWQQAGEPEGRDEEFWLQAEDEIDNPIIRRTP